MASLINPITQQPIGVTYNQQNIGTTVRPSSTALLTIDSEDRFQSQTPYADRRATLGLSYNSTPFDFWITKAGALLTGFFTRLAVSEVVFPTAALPNINITTQIMLVTYELSGGSEISVNITLPVGFYSPFQLAAAIQAFVRTLDATLAGFTIQYGVAKQCRFTYATNSTTSIRFAPMVYNSVAYPFGTTTRQLFDLLGMSNFPNNVLAIQAATNITLCQASRYFDIVSPQLTYNQPLKDSSSQDVVRDSLCRLYVADPSQQNLGDMSGAGFVPAGCAPMVIYRNFNNPKQIAWSPNQPVGQLSFQIYDDCGNPCTLYNTGTSQTSPDAFNVNWSMTLLVSEN